MLQEGKLTAKKLDLRKARPPLPTAEAGVCMGNKRAKGLPRWDRNRVFASRESGSGEEQDIWSIETDVSDARVAKPACL